MAKGPRDHYEVLGVTRQATADQIKAAYRRLARELHPDVNKAPDAARKFAEVQEAYDVLSDAQKRKKYDLFGHVGPAGEGESRPRGTYSWTNVAGQPGAGGADFGEFDVGSMFEEIFGRAGAGTPTGGAGSPFGAHARARSRAARGRDIAQDVAVDFMLAAKGGVETLRIRRGGATQTIEVKVPAGITEGTRLRVRGAGSPSNGGATPGDLILTVHISPHPHFRRENNDVLIDLPLTIAEATLGTSVKVPTLTGSAEVSVPPGTGSGQRLRLRGQGIQPEEGTPGDMLVVIKVVTPRDLSAADRQTLEDLGKRLSSPRQGPPWTV